MCGIAGIVRPQPIPDARLRLMAASIEHRGPDDEGIRVLPGVGLAHRRLAIVDLSPGGHQPMTNEDESLWIVFNGEVYNHRELVPRLEAEGHVFRSTSDTETILHAYEQWGPDCVEHFNGMWGLAIWDSRTRRLFCSRDRFGVKPFYYHVAPSGTFVFGSEIKAVLAAGVPAKVDRAYAAHVLVDGQFDDGEETFFEGIRQLPPAHSMLVEADGSTRVWRHWDFDPEAARERWRFDDPAEGVRELLADAVRLRVLSSDVRVGSCLSGGLDSSTVVAMASACSSVPMATFSCSYDSPGFDERRWAGLVADRFGCDAHSVMPRAEDFFGVLERMAWFQDEPATGPGLYSQWHVMALANGNVKVLLDGQGGDELMAGYRYHLEPYLQELARRAMRGDLDAARRLACDGPRVAEAWGMSPYAAAARAFGPARLKQAYLRSRGKSGVDDATPELVAEAQAAARERRPTRRFRDALNQRLYDDLARDVIPSLLHYEDRNSMAFSIEARTPFLDYRLVEYVLSLPGTLKVRDGQSKWLMRKAVAGITPDEVLARRDKLGYATPVGDWFRGELREQARDILLSPEARDRGVLNIPAIERKLASHDASDVDLGWQIYRWLSIEQWFRTFAEGRDPRLGAVEAL